MNNFNKGLRGTIKLNKYMFMFLFIFFLFSAGASYAYFAYQVEKTSVIAGNIVSINADLTVDLVVGTNDEMVPLQDEALSNAINGVGSPNGACIDSMNNLSCQVYKITLTNNGSRLKNLKGTVELYAKSGDGNAYQNLKWRKLTDTTTVQEGSVINGMEKSVLETGLTIQSKSTLTWYIAVWISNIDSDQKNIDKGQFEGKVTFEAEEVVRTQFIEQNLKQNAVLDNIASEYVTSETGIDFTTISSDTNGKGIYLKSGTENDTYPIYYYRGDVDNNNIIFAGFCWKIVRTTETGGMKLIYNGVSNGTQCNNTRIASIISIKAFNEEYNSPAYVGYMYGTPYQIQYLDDIPSSRTMTVGNSVTYSNGQYTLVNTKTDTWANLYNGGFDNYHYTCGTTEAKCDTVGYVYQTDESSGYGVVLTDGKTIEKALDEMLDYNTNGSTIKGNQSTVGTLDYWYATTIAPSYSNYIEDTVWCNDRSLYSLGGFDPNGGPTSIYTQQETMNLFVFNSGMSYLMGGTPELTCRRDIDKFTKSPENGNGDLDYSVGLLTIDELRLAGGAMEENDAYYLYTGVDVWAGSPIGFGNVGASESVVDIDGYLNYDRVGTWYGARPSVSLKPGFTIVEGGTGTASNPYVVS